MYWSVKYKIKEDLLQYNSKASGMILVVNFHIPCFLQKHIVCRLWKIEPNEQGQKVRYQMMGYYV